MKKQSNSEVLDEMVPNTELGAYLTTELSNQGMNVQQLADKLEEMASYEVVRRIVRGVSSPGLPLLKLICTKLKVDYAKCAAMLDRDRQRRRFGALVDVDRKDDPMAEKVSLAFSMLKKEQKEIILKQLVGFVGSLSGLKVRPSYFPK